MATPTSTALNAAIPTPSVGGAATEDRERRESHRARRWSSGGRRRQEPRQLLAVGCAARFESGLAGVARRRRPETGGVEIDSS